KMKPEIGTPSGPSQLAAIDGHWLTGTVKRELGCAAGPLAGSHGWPCQSSSPCGGSAVMPSHHRSPDRVSAPLVEVGLERTMAMPFGLVLGLVLGATPKNPRSGFTAQSWPCASTWIQAMSSPSVHTR